MQGVVSIAKTRFMLGDRSSVRHARSQSCSRRDESGQAFSILKEGRIVEAGRRDLIGLPTELDKGFPFCSRLCKGKHRQWGFSLSGEGVHRSLHQGSRTYVARKVRYDSDGAKETQRC
jgi:hypothetical protein